ncbi:MAG: hypothetical protein ACFFFT_04940 [Candidatus Thorarchaeota archaeon]
MKNEYKRLIIKKVGIIDKNFGSIENIKTDLKSIKKFMSCDLEFKSSFKEEFVDKIVQYYEEKVILEFLGLNMEELMREINSLLDMQVRFPFPLFVDGILNGCDLTEPENYYLENPLLFWRRYYESLLDLKYIIQNKEKKDFVENFF